MTHADAVEIIRLLQGIGTIGCLIFIISLFILIK